ncbi:MAG TPA: hypothetical protein VHO24_08130 [Opitutaceae bacterium]|nr:hypothetical protein [Opitutaceae bacterium]
MSLSSFRTPHSRTTRRLVAGGMFVLCFGTAVLFLAPGMNLAVFRPPAPATATPHASHPVRLVGAAHPPSPPAVGAITSPAPAVLSPLPREQDRLNAESIETLAGRDHRRALAFALAESNLPSRDTLLQAVLRGWAATDANAAADWARSQSYLESGQAMAAVFNGASRHPDEAVWLNRRLSTEDPDNAAANTGYLIFALARNEKFALAAEVAATGPSDSRVDLLTAAYGAWGEHHPKVALAHTAELKNPDIQHAAFQAVLGGWAKANPEELTEVAANLPAGPDRQLALVTALRQWIEKDPASAAEWARHANFFPEMEATLEE